MPLLHQALVALREVAAGGGRILFDHGALRTIRFPVGPTGGLPAGHEAFARILAPLGYHVAGVYPLPALKMTGHAYCHRDMPEAIPQYFVSELHVERFDDTFGAAARRVFGGSRDPLGPEEAALLHDFSRHGSVPFAQALAMLPRIAAAFERHHGTVRVSDYETLLARSAEAGWIATGGNAFNHATDRVADVDALAGGRGAVFAIPHMGNWDHAGAWASLAHSRVVTVAERLKPEGVYEQFLDYRRSLGMEIIPLTGGPPPYRTLLARLREGALVCLLADRDLTENGAPVRFFGAEARFPAGPAALAVQSGAPLLTAGLWYEPGRLRVRIRAVEVPDGERQSAIRVATQRIADRFAREIAEHPQDWHMLQRLWTADLDPARVPA